MIMRPGPAQFKGLLLIGAMAAGLGLGAYHRTPLSEASDTNGLPSSLSLSNAPLRKVSEDIYQLGQVRINKKTRTISFPAAVNMSDGIVEYAIVHSTGKVHESVLKTEADPLHIHLARLLAGPPAPSRALGGPRTPPELLGPNVTIEVRWKTEGIEKHMPLEDLVSNTLTETRMTRGEWIYNGSRLVQGTFLAHRDGSIVSVIADPDALINNPRPGREDDEIWKSNNALVPPVGTPVEVSIEWQIK